VGVSPRSTFFQDAGLTIVGLVRPAGQRFAAGLYRRRSPFRSGDVLSTVRSAAHRRITWRGYRVGSRDLGRFGPAVQSRRKLASVNKRWHRRAASPRAVLLQCSTSTLRLHVCPPSSQVMLAAGRRARNR
jgi:hypothetical protein